MIRWKRFTAWLCCVAVITVFLLTPAYAYDGAKSVILTEARTGTVLFEENADEALPPASVTKVMTLLLVMEAIDSGKITLQDSFSVSEHAASMGGSQIFLEVGETMTVEEMVKSVVVASANDAAVALAEYVCGSEEAFVAAMNQRASELGMKNTHFENTNGLDDNTENHLTSARDIAVMSAELMKHEAIFNYTTIWQDTVRNGAFTLSNTNRLIRFYRGATGLKTGSTSKAGFCISATAERDGLSLIAVVMGSPNRDTRNNVAKSLLDRGFSNYSFYLSEEKQEDAVPVLGSNDESCPLTAMPFQAVLKKGENGKVERSVEITEPLSAPITAGETVGSVVYRIGGEEIGRSDLLAAASVERISFGALFSKIFHAFALSL